MIIINNGQQQGFPNFKVYEPGLNHDSHSPGLIIGIYPKFPGEVHAAEPGTTL